MKLQIHWFAAFREATGHSKESVGSEAATVSELFEEMKTRHPALASARGAKVAINDELADWNSTLKDGDEILFFPPVAGG